MSLFDVALHQLSYPGTWYLNGGAMPTRVPRSAHQSIAPVQTVRTKDGWVYRDVHESTSSGMALVQRIGHPDLVDDPPLCLGQAARATTAPS